MTVVTNSRIATSHPVDRVLEISSLKVEIDPYARSALSETQEFFEARYPGAKDNIVGLGLGRIADVSARVNSTNLDDVTRLLLSNKAIYAVLIQRARDEDKVNVGDTEGFYTSVLRSVGELPKRYFLAQLLNKVISAKRVRLRESSKQWERLDDLTLARGLPVRVGQVEPAVMALLSTLYKEGDIPYYLDKYIARSAVAKTAFTPAVKRVMTEYLVKLGVQIKDEETFDKGTYDDYFLLAYNEAIKLSTVEEDPTETARIRGTELTWDFTVDTFETTEEQGIIPDNIRAAGALDYIYYVGDRMMVFNVANALVLRWASGALDVPDGKTATDLYRFHKKRSDRSTTDERAMLYKRVLNKGNGKLLSNMMPNQAFPQLWHSLMSEAADYIEKTEGSSKVGGSLVSKAPIYQATRDLQYNLTEHMTGMAHRQVHEDYAHLQDALNLLKSSEIAGYFGGRRKDLWNVIERVAKEDLSINVPTSTLRTLAVQGNRVFQWVANFNEGSVQEEDFRTFLSAAEAWILAQSNLESGDSMNTKDSKKKKEKVKDDDDFDDWEV